MKSNWDWCAEAIKCGLALIQCRIKVLETKKARFAVWTLCLITTVQC